MSASKSWFVFGFLILAAGCANDRDEEGGLGTPCVGPACVNSDNNLPGPGGNPDDPNGGLNTGVPVLGGGTHTMDAVQVTVVADENTGLTTPRDLAFNPQWADELWVVNLDGNATVVIQNLGWDNQFHNRYAGAGATHFMAKPSALAFGEPGFFGTAHMEDQPTQSTTPADFMGPTLWTSDLNIFDGGHAGHMDMLHNTPNGAGIAWDTGNAYYVYDGYHGSITHYDFQSHHGPGGADHSDGIVTRFVDGQVGFVPGIPSHLEKDQTTGLVYIADTANRRISVLDVSQATTGQPIQPNYDGTQQTHGVGAVLTTLVDGTSITAADGSVMQLAAPSGLELHNGHIYVSDNQASRIFAFDLQGNLVDWIDLSEMVGPGSLMGMAFHPGGDLLVVDAVGNRILRLSQQG